jgi:hypothetical protein
LGSRFKVERVQRFKVIRLLGSRFKVERVQRFKVIRLLGSRLLGYWVQGY